MKERIDVLALQATDSKGGLDRHKFAELIVRECAGIAQSYMSRWPEDHKLTKRIKEHFGVIE